MDELYKRVSARSDITYPYAVKRSRAVMDVLRQTISLGELEDILSEFPAGFEELFGKTPERPLSPTYLTA